MEGIKQNMDVISSKFLVKFVEKLVIHQEILMKDIQAYFSSKLLAIHAVHIYLGVFDFFFGNLRISHLSTYYFIYSDRIHLYKCHRVFDCFHCILNTNNRFT